MNAIKKFLIETFTAQEYIYSLREHIRIFTFLIFILAFIIIAGVIMVLFCRFVNWIF